MKKLLALNIIAPLFLSLLICTNGNAQIPINPDNIIKQKTEKDNKIKFKKKPNISNQNEETETRSSPSVINECANTRFFCSDTSFTFDYRVEFAPEVYICPSIIYLYYYFRVDEGGLPDLEISSPDGLLGYVIAGPYDSPVADVCNIDTEGIEIVYNNTTPASSYHTGTDIGTLPGAGYYYLLVVPDSCHSSIEFNVSEAELVCNDLPCENCIGSFAPEPGQKYLISTWVKEEGAAPSKTSYTEPEVYIEFPSATTTLGPFTATGVIIDGWQKVEEEFEIPLAATDMVLRLECGSGDCYFDDIRIFPYDGSMKTYVYDPSTLRLVAELDERNYATFYEYDEEGKLVRIKKETEKGIMTIQENKTSITKR